MTLPEYLKHHEGSKWNYENSAFVLAHVEQIERTYRAMLEQALAQVEAAAIQHGYSEEEAAARWNMRHGEAAK